MQKIIDCTQTLMIQKNENKSVECNSGYKAAPSPNNMKTNRNVSCGIFFCNYVQPEKFYKNTKVYLYNKIKLSWSIQSNSCSVMQ